MRPVLSADGEEINWVNYKTGIKGINFKMNAEANEASISIVLSQADIAVQKNSYDQFLQLKSMLHENLGEIWDWKPQVQNEQGRIISIISRTITGASINRNEDWPALISFFKPRMIALDAFWNMAKYGFEDFY